MNVPTRTQSHPASLSTRGGRALSGSARAVDCRQFIRILVNHVKVHGRKILTGQKPFSLNASCVKHLNRALEELQRASTSLSSYKADDDILQLALFVRNLEHLKLEPTLKNVVETRGIVDLRYFKALKALELEMVKPELIANIEDLSKQLEEVSVVGCLNSISELLDFQENTRADESVWRNLVLLQLPYNNIPSIDIAVSMLRSVQRLDLSHNLIAKVENLQFCYQLEQLDVGYNRITSVETIYETIGNIKVLSLKKNNIYSTRSLHKLCSLEVLDLSYNVISSIDDVKLLQGLPFLKELSLEGNPISQVDDYRLKVFQLFPDKFEKMILDGMRCTSYEKDVLYQWNILQTDLADSVRERQLLAGIKAARSTRYYAKKYKKKKKKKLLKEEKETK